MRPVANPAPPARRPSLDGDVDTTSECDVDLVDHPPHYNAHPSGVECIDVAEHFGFNLGNVIKYVWRADRKNGLEDLRKAEWYLRREIENRERGAM